MEVPCIWLVVLLLSGCASTGRTPANPRGTHEFEAWSGQWALRGVLVAAPQLNSPGAPPVCRKTTRSSAWTTCRSIHTIMPAAAYYD